jgi:methyl-accepting chemotaxis protein
LIDRLEGLSLISWFLHYPVSGVKTGLEIRHLYLWSAKMKIKARIYLLSTVAWLGLILVAGIGIYTSQEDSRVLKDITDIRMTKAETLLNARIQVNNEIRRTYEAVALQEIPVEERVPSLQQALAKKQESDKHLQEAIDTYDKLPRNAEADVLFAKVKDTYSRWKPAIITEGTQLLERGLNNPTEENLTNMSADLLKNARTVRNDTVAMTDLFGEMVDMNNKITAEFVADNDRISEQTFYVQVILSSLLILAAIFLSITTLKAVVGPVEKVRDAVKQVERENDLRMRVDYHSGDEVGEMVFAFNNMMNKLQNSFQEIQARIVEVKGAVDSLSTAAQEVATSSASQSSSTSAMAASVEEVTVSISTVSASAGEAQSMASHAGEVATEGSAIIENTATEMGSIAESVTQASRVIQALGEESQQISSVVQVIKEVADQTNLLALNAAIEAARAGEQGRGFAVVADEVRKLAERTAQSTGDISGMIGKIQVSAKEAVGEMDHVVEQVGQGQELAKQANERIRAISGETSKVSDAVTEISNALKEQSQASQDIAKNVESIAQMTDENNAAAEETAAGAKRLDELAEAVTQVVNQFKV